MQSCREEICHQSDSNWGPQREFDRQEGYVDARKMGSDILSVRQIRQPGIYTVLERIPASKTDHVTIDFDGYDISIAPGTGTPSHGGFMYYKVLELIDGIARRGTVVGLDLSRRHLIMIMKEARQF